MTRATYLIRESLVNMQRNLLVVLAAVLAVFVSLALALSALMVSELFRVNTLQWQEGTHVIVFLRDTRDGIAPEAHLALLGEVLEFDVVETASYVDKSGAYDEFSEMFANTPSIIREIDPSVLPASIRIKLNDITRYQEIDHRLAGDAAVRQIVAPGETIERLANFSTAVNVGGLSLAVVQGIAAIVLISNTIRMAIYARREEVSIMKLVGASNWFIRVPFLVEGMLEGLAGAGLAVVTVAFLRRWVSRFDGDLDIFQLVISDGYFYRWSLLFLLFGALAGVAGSALGLRRFLKV